MDSPSAEDVFRDAPNRYGATAARAHPKAQALDCRAIDTHAHVLIPAAAEYVAPFLGPSALERYANDESKAINKRQIQDRKVEFTDPHDRIKALAKLGLARQVVSCNPPQCYYGIPADKALKASQIINDGLAAFVATAPERFVGLGTVPLQDPKSFVGEFRRAVRDLGFKGIQVLTEVGDRELSDPAFEPLWQTAAELDAVVMLHPAGYTEGRRLSEYYFSNVIGNPLGTTVALHHLIFSGVLERYPKLNILAVHGGGFLASYSGRIDHAWGARRDARASLPRPPSEYLRKMYFDSVVFTTHQLEYLVRTFGADHIVIGTDYPADMGEYDPVEHIAACDGLSMDEKLAIAERTAARLFGIAAT